MYSLVFKEYLYLLWYTIAKIRDCCSALKLRLNSIILKNRLNWVSIGISISSCARRRDAKNRKMKNKKLDMQGRVGSIKSSLRKSVPLFYSFRHRMKKVLSFIRLFLNRDDFCNYYSSNLYFN